LKTVSDTEVKHFLHLPGGNNFSCRTSLNPETSKCVVIDTNEILEAPVTHNTRRTAAVIHVLLKLLVRLVFINTKYWYL